MTIVKKISILFSVMSFGVVALALTNAGAASSSAAALTSKADTQGAKPQPTVHDCVITGCYHN
jgi:hypothetical protein